MTNVFQIVKVNAAGKIESCESVQAITMRVRSEETMPKGCGLGTEAFIVDKMDVAICDGQDNWYRRSGSSIVNAAAGMPWSALF